MSKEGSLHRISKYKLNGQVECLALEEEFYNKTYGAVEKVVEEKPKEKKAKVNKE